ncbi:hypothetical protein [Agarilytica rhodophyticola]|uniref:hypothetical protein n=1 Tax=Agarilytica rhodophyticola TaxID=1737490 RepID=UPI000B347FD3|nr:hypothetical protein [Agarilytica rhodophyticola]
MSKIGTRQVALENILRRSDTWQGDSHRLTQHEAITSGYPELDKVLQHGGWPLATLIEVCQYEYSSEWYLFHHTLKTLNNESQSGDIALINPPALPFIGGLAQLEIPYHKILVVETANTQQFIKCFSDISYSTAYSAIFAWQQQFSLSYSQLRKLQLNSSKQNGLYVIFRHIKDKQRSSPASLRLISQPNEQTLTLNIFKQRGNLENIDVQLPIPSFWEKILPHKYLCTASGKQNNATYTLETAPKIFSNASTHTKGPQLKKGVST